MSINFCHPCLNPLLSCDKICSDGYELSNVIAVDSSLQKGFLVDYFIKPPVTITIQVMCNIDLECIIIYPRVGAQKSVGFEVHASRESSGNNFHKIGLAYIPNSKDCVVFSKKNIADVPERRVSIPFARNFFFNLSPHSIRNIRTVSIKITKTLHSSVPSIKRIEIWGRPSESCDVRSRKKAEMLWAESTLHAPECRNSDVEPLLDQEKICEENELNVPEEFIDVITCNIMALPMLLPSGKTIDQSTVEKCARVDATNGRTPSDPFTGEVFTDRRKPIFLPSLKVRIDKFLNENAHHEIVRKTSRTVGKRKSNANIRFSKKACISTPSRSGLVNFHSRDQNGFVFTTLLKSNRSVPVEKDKRLNFSDSNSTVKASSARKSNSLIESGRDLRQSNSLEIETIYIDESNSAEVIDLSDDDGSPSCSSYSVNNIFFSKSCNVDNVLKRTLANLPSFTQPVKYDVPSPKLCCTCSISTNLYQLPCYHFLCRPCLLSNTNNLKVSCTKCNLKFSSSEPVRYHQ